MELLILLVVFLVLLLVGANRIKNENNIFKKVRRILGSVAILISVVGVVTPFNFVYGFIIAYILVFAIWLSNKKLKEK